MPSWQSRILSRIWGRMTAHVSTWATPQEMRTSMAASIGQWAFLPRGVRMQKVTAGGVPAEWLIPVSAVTNEVLLYIHGGAWTMGWYEPHRWLVSHLARAAGRRALALDYRLAPEYPFPAALDDCLAAYRWLLADGTPPERIVIGGDSAGGNLTLATMLALRANGEPLPAAGVCLSPATNLVDESGAESNPPAQLVKDAGLPVEWAREQLRMYLGGADPRQPLVSPLYADLRGLPPLLIQAGEAEYLAEDARRLAERARAAGVDVTLEIWPGMWHVWQILVPFMPEASQAVQAIAAFVRDVAERNPSPGVQGSAPGSSAD